MLAALRHRRSAFSHYKQALLRRLDGSEPDAELPPGGQLERCLVAALFITMGKLAKLGRRVSRVEIDFANRIMQQLGLQNGARSEAIAQFDSGNQSNSDVMQPLAQLVKIIAPQSPLACQCLRVLCDFVQLQDVVQLQVRILLRDVAEILGYDKSALQEIGALKQSRQTALAPPSSKVLDAAYHTLGLHAHAEDLEVRKAYLRLMSRYHPDKIQKDAVTPESTRSAHENSLRIRTAYETVCGHRKLSV